MKATLRAAAALAGTVSLFALATPALAQDAAAPADAEATSLDEAPPGEIVVTAQKRTERLQDVPVAVSVLSADALATSSKPSLESAVALVPSLNFVKAGTALNQTLFLRGLGTTTLSIAVDPSVSPCSTASFSAVRPRRSPIWSTSNGSKCCAGRRARCSGATPARV